MKKAGFLIAMAMFLAVFGAEVAAAECRGDLAGMASGSDPHGRIGGSLETECATKKAFHVPAAVPLFLSAIAGLGVVALGGRPR